MYTSDDPALAHLVRELENFQDIASHLIPLPGEGQVGVARPALEFVGGDDAGGAGDALSAGGDVERHGHLVVFAENGPAVLPSHGHEVGNAADGGVVLEKIGIPFAFRGVDEAALGDTAIGKGDATLVGPIDDVGAARSRRDCQPAVTSSPRRRFASFRRA